MHTHSKFKILLINAINPHVEVDGRFPSLGLAYLVAAVRKAIPNRDFDFKIIDKDIYLEVSRNKPDLVGITSVSKNFNIAKTYADYLAGLGIPVVMGGIHVSMLPELLPPSVVVGCIGEGEHTFAEIVKACLGSRLNSKTLSNISGIIYWENGTLIRTSEREYENNLDHIAMPARDLLRIGKNAHMISSRGCPYQCIYCSAKTFWKKVRFFSAEYIAREIETLYYDHNVEGICFTDDLFISDRFRIREIISLLKEKGILGRVKFSCTCRANLVDEELTKILKHMGVVDVGLGFESGNDDNLRYLKVGDVSVAKNSMAIKLLKSAGIHITGNFIIGSPRETKTQIMQTYEFIKKNDLDFFNVYPLTPFPGTNIWDHAKKRGLVSEKMLDWSQLDLNPFHTPRQKIIMLSETLSKKEFLSLYRKFFRLRFWRIVFRITRHPFREDVTEIIFKLLKERLYYLLHR